MQRQDTIKLQTIQSNEPADMNNDTHTHTHAGAGLDRVGGITLSSKLSTN